MDDITVARALRHLGDTLAVPVMIELFESPDSDHGERTRAARVLGGLEDAAAVPSLIWALEDSARVVRSSATHSLGDLRDPRAFQPLVNLLNDEACQFGRWWGCRRRRSEVAHGRKLWGPLNTGTEASDRSLTLVVLLGRSRTGR